MTSESQNNQNYGQFFNNEKILNVDILSEFLLATGEAISSETFKKIMEEQDNEEYKNIALKFNDQVKSLTKDEYKKIAAPITARVTKVYSDGCVDVQRPQDKEGHCWTHIPNSTIFRYLEVGDEVVLGYYNGEQKSNCWVMFAKLSPSEFKRKTIYRDIENLKIIHNNTKFLEKWLQHLGARGAIQDVYPKGK